MKSILIAFSVLLGAYSAKASTHIPQRLSNSLQTAVFDPKDSVVTVAPVLLDSIGTYLVYPKQALEKKLEGTVMVTALLSTTGTVEETFVSRTSDSIFNQAATDAVQQLHFRPATQNGKPVRAWWTVSIVFALPRKK